MAPVSLRFKDLSFGWYSNEAGEPAHVHVWVGSDRSRSAKFWLRREGPVMAHNKAGLSPAQIRIAKRSIALNRDMFVARWHDFFDD